MNIMSDKADIVAAIERLMKQFEQGEVTCAAIRAYNTDGTFEDIVIGGSDDEERAQTLADLHAQYARLN